MRDALRNLDLLQSGTVSKCRISDALYRCGYPYAFQSIAAIKRMARYRSQTLREVHLRDAVAVVESVAAHGRQAVGEINLRKDVAIPEGIFSDALHAFSDDQAGRSARGMIAIAIMAVCKIITSDAVERMVSDLSNRSPDFQLFKLRAARSQHSRLDLRQTAHADFSQVRTALEGGIITTCKIAEGIWQVKLQQAGAIQEGIIVDVRDPLQHSQLQALAVLEGIPFDYGHTIRQIHAFQAGAVGKHIV